MEPSAQLHCPANAARPARSPSVRVVGSVPDGLQAELSRLGVGIQLGATHRGEGALALVGLEAAAPAWGLLDQALAQAEVIAVFKGEAGVEVVREAFRRGAAEVLLAGDRDAAERVLRRFPLNGGSASPPTRPVHGLERDLKTEVEAFENGLIRQALTATAGNRNQAAQLLGIKRTTLVEKLKKRNLG